MKQTPVDFSVRDPAAGVNNLFVQRWSPRAYLPTLIPEHDLHTIFDAARWSPSCYNEQPWQFISSTPATHAQFLRLLVEANQQWAKHAPVLGFVIANKYFARNGKPNVHALFDAGAAWMAVNLQASLLGYHAHGMGGIDYDAVSQEFQIDPARQQVICGFSLGKVEYSAQEEITQRKPLQAIWQQRT